MCFYFLQIRGKFIAIQSYLKKQETSQINNLTLHLKQLEKEEHKNPKVSIRKEIIKIRSEINETEMKETIAKINKTKSWFFEKINKIDKPLARFIKKKREKAQINRIRKEKEVTTDTTEIQRIMRDYYKQVYTNKKDTLEETDKFLEKHNLLRLKQEEIENISRQITSTKIETVTKNLPTNKSPGPDDGFTGEFYQTFREELTPILLKLFQDMAE